MIAMHLFAVVAEWQSLFHEKALYVHHSAQHEWVASDTQRSLIAVPNKSYCQAEYVVWWFYIAQKVYYACDQYTKICCRWMSPM